MILVMLLARRDPSRRDALDNVDLKSFEEHGVDGPSRRRQVLAVATS